MPALDVIERVCSEALTCGTRQVNEAQTARRWQIITAALSTLCWRSAKAPKAAALVHDLAHRQLSLTGWVSGGVTWVAEANTYFALAWIAWTGAIPSASMRPRHRCGPGVPPKNSRFGISPPSTGERPATPSTIRRRDRRRQAGDRPARAH